MEISNTYIFWGVIKIGEERRRQNDFKKKTFAGQNRQKYLSFTSMYLDFANSQKKKKTIQNTIPKRKIARWNTLTSVWSRVSNQDPKKLFFNPEKKMVDI